MKTLLSVYYENIMTPKLILSLRNLEQNASRFFLLNDPNDPLIHFASLQRIENGKEHTSR